MSTGIYLAEACRWYVLTALLVAAIGKSMRFGAFHDSLHEAFPRLGRSGAALSAFAILAGEWSAGILMLAGGDLSRIGLMLSLVLFVSLTVVVAVVLAQGLSIRCNCFGASQQRISGFDLVRNLLFIAAAGIGLQGASAVGDAGALNGLPLSATVPIIAVALMLFNLSVNLREVAQLMQARTEDL